MGMNVSSPVISPEVSLLAQNSPRSALAGRRFHDQDDQSQSGRRSSRPRRVRQCAGCGNRGTNYKQCQGCRSSIYCSVACQRRDWPVHKWNCRAMQGRHVHEQDVDSSEPTQPLIETGRPPASRSSSASQQPRDAVVSASSERSLARQINQILDQPARPGDVYMNNNVYPDSEEHRRIPPVHSHSHLELVRSIRVRGQRVREISRELQAGVNPSARLSLMEELSQLRVQNDSEQLEVFERNSRELERDSLMSNASSNNTAIDMDREELFGPEDDESIIDAVDRVLGSEE